MRWYSVILWLHSFQPQVASRKRFSNMNKNIKLIFNYVIGPLVFFILVYSIYVQIQRQPDWEASVNKAWEAFTGAASWKIILVVLLMFINWGLEARKWQVAIRRIQHISFFTAFQAVFSGTTLAFFTPNRMGEYFGRIWYIDKGKRIQAISLTIVCSISQLLITLSGGIAGLEDAANDR